MEEKIAQLKKRSKEINEMLNDASIGSNPSKLKALTQEQSAMTETLSLIAEYETAQHAIKEAESIMNGKDDADLAELAKIDLLENQAKLPKLLAQLELALLPKDPNDSKDVIIEIRAGAGGDEAALFAASLFKMYTRYSEDRGWKVSIMNNNRNGIGGSKEVIAEIHGTNVYADLKYESGVHRVQRIPETEKNGRVHTSTATVAILPEAEDIEMEIKPGDLRVDVYRSGGHGGQSVNTTDSAVRITHIPSGIVVTCQNERSQLKNKEQAMKVLKTRLYEADQEKKMKTEGDARRIQIGTGDRSEKIRTYNFPQDRVTDHRIKFSTHGLDKIMEGAISPLLTELKKADQNAKLASDTTPSGRGSASK
jgi:peptide chain release factor 1